MAPVVRLHRLVWGGRLFDTEQWSCSLHFGSPDTASGDAADYEPALKAWMTRVGSNISSFAHLDEVKFNIINPTTGRYLFPVSNTDVLAASVTGAKDIGPGQNTLAVTTRTALARGRGHAGRFYPPTGSFSQNMSADGRMAATDAQACALSAAQLISALNAVNPEIHAVVFSKVGQSQEAIVGVSVGRVLDTMRSRRTSLLEDPQASPLT